MKFQNPQLRSIVTLTFGHIIVAVITIVTFFLLDQYDTSVLLGIIAGIVISITNFRLLSLCANRAADRAEKQDVAGGKNVIQFSYLVRMVGIFLTFVLLADTGYFHPLTLVLPLLFTRPILTIQMKRDVAT